MNSQSHCRRSIAFVGIVLVSALGGWSFSASGTWVAIPIDVLIEESDIVVVGEIVEEVGDIPRKYRDFERLYTRARLKVRETLKGPDSEVIFLEYPSLNEPVHSSADIHYRVGSNGIWILNKQEERDCYVSGRPDRLQKHDRRKEIDAVFARFGTREYSEAVNGLQLFFEPTKTAYQRDERILLSFGLRNASVNDLTILDHWPSRPIRLLIGGNNRSVTEVDAYESFKEYPGPPRLSAHYFRTISSGGVARKVTQLYGQVRLPAQNPGRYEITLLYANSETGDAFGIKNPWLGELKATTTVQVE